MKYTRTKINGVDCVVVEYEAVVNVGQLRANLEQFKIEAAIANKKVAETEEMLKQVGMLAPDLLAAFDRASNVLPIKTNRAARRRAARRG